MHVNDKKQNKTAPPPPTPQKKLKKKIPKTIKKTKQNPRMFLKSPSNNRCYMYYFVFIITFSLRKASNAILKHTLSNVI